MRKITVTVAAAITEVKVRGYPNTDDSGSRTPADVTALPAYIQWHKMLILPAKDASVHLRIAKMKVIQNVLTGLQFLGIFSFPLLGQKLNSKTQL